MITTESVKMVLCRGLFAVFSGFLVNNCSLGLTSRTLCAKINLALDGDLCGEVSEWFMELVLKTSDSRERTMGSNPILSAILCEKVNSLSL